MDDLTLEIFSCCLVFAPNTTLDIIGNIGNTHGVKAIAKPKTKNAPAKTIGEIVFNNVASTPASSLAPH